MATEYEKLPAALLPWYRENARDLPWRRDREPYHIWISEIMLQQTRTKAVLEYYSRFLAELPRIQDLACASEDQLFKLWEGLGYYTRAKNLQKTARLICENYNGHFPDDYAVIRTLPGIGPYTAGAIASICFDLPTPAVDGNVLRVTARITNDFRPIDLPMVKSSVSESLAAVYPKNACGDFTQALMELGATVCTPRSPKCALCPASVFCQANAAGTATMLPIRSPKPKKRVEEKTVFLFSFEKKLALNRRTEPGLLSGLWQFPNVPGLLDAQTALETAVSFGLHPRELVKELHRNHIFTHIRWEMTCYEILCDAAPEDFIWATVSEIRTRYALPTAFRQFLPFEKSESKLLTETEKRYL